MGRARGEVVGLLVAVLLLAGLLLAGASPAWRVAAVPPPATFAAAVNYATGGGANTVAIGDVNGDNKPDIVVANVNEPDSTKRLSVLINNGDGTFAAAAYYTVAASPAGVAIGDVNGDNKPDIVTGGSDGTVSVFLNNGDGTFAAAATYTAASGISTASDVALGDLNGDNKLDIVASNQGSASVTVLINSGTGTFPARTTYGAGAGTFPIDVTLGDLNGDNKLDIVSANSTNTISVLLNNGNGTFGGATQISGFDAPTTTAIADLNGDGKADLVVANVAGSSPSNPNVLSVLLGNGNGTFRSAVTYPASFRPDAVAISDVNGDGILDLVVTNEDSRINTVSVLLGNGDGTFGTATAYGVGSDPGGIAVGDLNGDGKPDIVTANYSGGNASVLLNTTTGPRSFVVTTNADDANDANCTVTRCTLRQAVNASNANDPGMGANAITFDPAVFGTAQTITLSAQRTLTLSRSVTITGPGANLLTVARSTAMGTAQFRIFQINSGLTATVSGLTITGGDVLGNGGGIANSGTLALTNVTVSGNTANGGGGGITNSGGTLTLTGSTVSGNTSNGGGGGGIVNVSGGTLTLTGSTVSGNTGGGGIFSNSGTTTMLTDSTVSGNTASNGGGIGNSGALTLINVTVSDNTATSTGGGIVNSGTLTLTNVTVSGNTATGSVGGGIRNIGTTNATNSIIAGNSAPNSPGTANLAGGLATDVSNLTSGAPLLAPLGTYGGPTQTRPPLPGSPAIDTGTNAGCPATDQRGLSRPVNTNCDIGAVESRGFAFSAPTGGGQSAPINTAFGTALTVTVTGNMVAGMIREPVDGGVVTFTATAAGNGASIAPNPTTATIPTAGPIGDGLASATVTANGTAGGPYTVNATAAGTTGTAAYSLTNTPVTCVVTNTADGGAGSLREKVGIANAGGCAMGTITFDASFDTPQTIALVAGNGRLALTGPVTIDGTGRRVTVSGGGNVQVFYVSPTAVAALTALTVTGGNAGGGSGGGVSNSGTVTLTNVTLSGNTATSGGGLTNVGTATLVNVTVSGNTATSVGGGLFNSVGTTTLVDVTVSGNTSSNVGGGIRVSDGAVTLAGSVVAGNTAPTNPDLSGGATADATSVVNVDAATARLAPLGDYGGPVRTMPPLPGSPALDRYAPASGGNCGTAAIPVTTDGRGLSRPVNTNCDAGAAESRGFTVTKTGGDNQGATVGTAFAQPLGVAVTGSIGEPVQGGAVTFALPASGASGTFGTLAGCALSAMNTAATCTVGTGGAATSPQVTANLTAGMYNAAATASGVPAMPATTFTLTNTPPTIAVTPATLPTGVVGGVTAIVLAATGGTAPYTFALAPMSGPLPPGLMLAANGTLAGTPTMAGMFTFTVRATDANMFTGDRQYTVTILPVVTLAPAALPNGTVGGAYSQSVTASGGTGMGYTFALVPAMGEQLPPGLMLDGTTGAITGTPTTQGAFTFTVRATDGGTNTATKQYTVTILPAVAVQPAALPNGTAGVAYSQTLAATGGTGAGYSFALVPATGQQLPPGLALAPGGTLAGTPTVAGMFAFTIRATDGGMNAGDRQYTVTIGAATLTGIAATRQSGGSGTGSSGSVAAGGAVQLALTATFTDGSMQPVPGGAMWGSSDPGKATVDASGKIAALAPGTVTITATYMGQTTTFTLTITAPGTGGLMPNPAPVARPDAATAPAGVPTPPPLPAPPTRAAAAGNTGGGIGAQGSGTATPTPRPAPPTR